MIDIISKLLLILAYFNLVESATMEIVDQMLSEHQTSLKPVRLGARLQKGLRIKRFDFLIEAAAFKTTKNPLNNT